MSELMHPASQKPSIVDVLPLVERYYESNPTGGYLHIVLDDGDVSDDSVRYCLNQAIDAGDLDAENIAKTLLKMSKTQRIKLYRSTKAKK